MLKKLDEETSHDVWGTLMDIQNFADELLNETIVLRQKIEGKTMIDWTKEDQERLDNIHYMIRTVFPTLDVDKLSVLDNEKGELNEA